MSGLLLRELASLALNGAVLTPDHPDYDRYRRVWNGVADRRPLSGPGPSRMSGWQSMLPRHRDRCWRYVAVAIAFRAFPPAMAALFSISRSSTRSASTAPHARLRSAVAPCSAISTAR
jgi:hypothetical protein